MGAVRKQCLEGLVGNVGRVKMKKGDWDPSGNYNLILNCQFLTEILHVKIFAR